MKFKIQNLKFKIIVFLIFAFLFFNFAFLEIASAELTIKANQDQIKIDFFYHGSEVTVSGEADSGTDLVIKITSPEGHQVLRKKGKVAGLLWMNVGELKFEHTPNLYFLHSTKKLEEILNPEEMDKYIIGYPALKRHIEITPVANEDEKTKWFDEFVKFKESKEMYSVSSERVSTTQNEGKQNYYIRLNWPYQAQPDDYTATAYAIKDKKILETATTKVHVEQVGTVKALANIAKNKGALYGVISIVVALAAGFGVGMIFRKGKGAH